jgi:hypothetical protein
MCRNTWAYKKKGYYTALYVQVYYIIIIRECVLFVHALDRILYGFLDILAF